MEKILRFGIIGPGGIADSQLAPALARVPGTALWSVMSRDHGRAAAFALKHGAASPSPAHADLGGMLADPALDAVVIATPDKLHAPQAIAAAAAGKHVFVEKPMATNADDAFAMVAACREAGVRLGVGYHNRWHAGHRLLAKAVADGALGSLRHMRVHWSYEEKDATNWRAHDSVGRWWCMAALGTHCLDVVRWMMVPQCGEVRAVRALFSNAKFRSPHDETATVLLRFTNGATAEILASVAMRPERTIEIHGDKASARCEWTLGAKGVGAITVGGSPLAFVPANPYVGELADFAAAVREGREPEVDGEEGAKNVALLVAAEDSNGW
ncbi:MAG TPA: Gfo/Idh/MocA family oxidoreductase [Candidatus Eisenbacteria bacterium]|nr:Gfo/Idh/MocA family oxidoreductase [Candidatus Eisenbacteria bacterium]